MTAEARLVIDKDVQVAERSVTCQCSVGLGYWVPYSDESDANQYEALLVRSTQVPTLPLSAVLARVALFVSP